jgi:hypothetical protein
MTKPDAAKQLKAMETSLAAIKVLTQDEQVWVLEWLARNLGLDSPVVRDRREDPGSQTGDKLRTDGDSGAEAGATPRPKAFMAAKAPKTDVHRIVCLAYYLTKYKSTPKFTNKQLTDLAVDAAEPEFSNAAQAIGNAQRSKLLAGAGGKLRQITHRGESLVDAMPDEAKMKAVSAAMPAGRRKGPKRKRTAKAKA